MHLVSTLALGLLASVPTATATVRCGTSPPSLGLRSISEQTQGQIKRALALREHISINTYVHVVGADDTVEEGYIGVSNSLTSNCCGRCAVY